jgi:hypothetical protein
MCTLKGPPNDVTMTSQDDPAIIHVDFLKRETSHWMSSFQSM